MGGRGDHQPAQRPEQGLRGQHLIDARRGDGGAGRLGPLAQVLRRDLGEVALLGARVLQQFARRRRLRLEPGAVVGERQAGPAAVEAEAGDDVDDPGRDRFPGRIERHRAEPAAAVVVAPRLPQHRFGAGDEGAVGGRDRHPVDLLGADPGVVESRGERLASEIGGPAAGPEAVRGGDAEEMDQSHAANIAARQRPSGEGCRAALGVLPKAGER